MKYKVYKLTICDEATLLAEFTDYDEAKRYRNMLYYNDERDIELPREYIRYFIITD